MNISDFRQKHPEYDDMSDVDLAAALHRKHYSDIPKDQFYKQVGVEPARPNTAMDVARSVGSALVTGTEKFVGFLGDTRDAMPHVGDEVGNLLFGGEEGRKARDARVQQRIASSPVAQFLQKAHPPSVPFPTSQQVADTQRPMTGFKPHQPQTTAGEFAHTAAEFVPGAVALGPGRGLQAMGANALKFGVAPGLTSEGAGQLVRNSMPEWEGAARFAGALAGPFAASGVRRAITPTRSSPPHRTAAQRLEGEGVQTTGGQRTGNMQLKRREQQAQGGAPMADFHRTQLQQFTRAALRRVGIDVDAVPPNVADDIANGFDARFQALARQSRGVLNGQDIQRIRRAYNEYNSLTSELARVPAVREAAERILNIYRNGGRLTGQQYNYFRSVLGARARAIASSGSDGYQGASALREIQHILDDAMERGMSGTLAAEWRATRRQYGNWIPIREALAGSADATIGEGLLSPRALLSVLKRGNNKHGYVRGWGDLNQLARDGATVLTSPNTSGTAENLFARLANSGGGMLPAAGGAAAGWQTGQSMETAILGMLAAQSAKQGVERARTAAMFSPLGRQYYSNQFLPPPAYDWRGGLAPAGYGGLLTSRGGEVR